MYIIFQLFGEVINLKTKVELKIFSTYTPFQLVME